MATLPWTADEDDALLKAAAKYEDTPDFELIKKHYPHFMHRFDKEGHPFFYERPAGINLTALHEAGVSHDILLKHYLFVTEYLWQVRGGLDSYRATAQNSLV